MRSYSLKEEKAEETSSHEEDSIAYKSAEKELCKNNETEWNEFVARVRKKLKEGWGRLGIGTKTEEVEASFEYSCLKKPHKHGFGINVA